jgi:oxygen-independent coproporphyrinogen-3 oxidase
MDNANSEQRISSCMELTEADVKLEFMLNALRLDRGFTAADFSDTTGLPFSCMQETVTKACEDGLLVQDKNTIQTTPQGKQHLNELLQYWVNDTTGGNRARTG